MSSPLPDSSSSASQGAEIPVQVGDVLAGKYVVERVLGVGGMGAVVAATHRYLGDRVALKFMLPDLARSTALVRRFMKEARAARSITSEHVVRVSDIGTLEGGEPYIVMEYLQGHDLAEELSARGPLAVESAVDYVMQALQAVAEAHAKGIVHRDLKPSNLFLARRADGTPLVKVLDFGIAKAQWAGAQTVHLDSESSGSIPLLGSPCYVSPEQIRSSRDVDPRTDVWAVGVILYELLTGKTPFIADEVGGILAAILTERPVPMRDHRLQLPAELERVVMACLEKELERRTKSVADLGVGLAPFGSADARLSLTRILGIAGAAIEPSSAPRRPLWSKVTAVAAGLGATIALALALTGKRGPTTAAPTNTSPSPRHASSAAGDVAERSRAQDPTKDPAKDPPPRNERPVAESLPAGARDLGPPNAAAVRPGGKPARRTSARKEGARPASRAPANLDALFEDRR